MKWIVLSDLHMKFKNCTTEIARKKLIEALKREKETGIISFILITGDCMHQNKVDLEKTKKFIQEIAEVCEVENERIFICPGNHDINRNNYNRNRAITNFRKKNELPQIDICLDGYGNFNALFNSVTGKFYKPFSTGDIENFRIITVDSCLLSMNDKDSGELAVGFPELSDLSDEIKDDGKINIVIMHHGIEWLKPEDARRFQHWLADNRISMVFCGHNHAVGMNILTEAIPNNSIPRQGILQFTCGAAFSDSYAEPTFFVGEYKENKMINIKLYGYQQNSEWEIKNSALRSFPKGNYRESSFSEINEIPQIYKTIFDADSDIAEEVKISKRLDFFGLRGRICLKENSKTANYLYERKNEIMCRILVSDPYNKNIDKRLRYVPEFASQLNLEQQWRNIYEDIKRLRDIQGKNVRFHELPLLFRFILTDKSVYFGYYSREPSSKSCMYRYSNQSSLYFSIKDFFDNVWASANTSFNSVIPDRCSFLTNKFDMTPSLVINLTDDCNMNCRYCPSGGENLKKCSNLCDIEQIKYLLTAFIEYCNLKQWSEKRVIRITGGEPLLVSDRLNEILSHAKREGFQKIVLCTNGINLQQCYEKDTRVWESVKDILLLKISLDSLNNDVFNKLTGCDELDTVLENISFAQNKGFKIELNFVATKDNVDEIGEVYDYAYRAGLLGVKVLTINDFGGRVQTEDVETNLNKIMNEMRARNYIETGLYVHNNKGIHMKRFIHDGCTLTIVDHMNKQNSITPRRTYSKECRSCWNFPDSIKVKKGQRKPCATGIMSLTMRADGLLSFCRLREDKGNSIMNKNLDEISKLVNKQLSYFQKCYHYEVGETHEKI